MTASLRIGVVLFILAITLLSSSADARSISVLVSADHGMSPSTPLVGATVVDAQGVSKNTGLDGWAIFTGEDTGELGFTASKDGYQDGFRVAQASSLPTTLAIVLQLNSTPILSGMLGLAVMFIFLATTIIVLVKRRSW